MHLAAGSGALGSSSAAACSRAWPCRPNRAARTPPFVLCRLRKALAKLREINSVAWGTHLPGPAAAQQRAPPGRPPAAFKRGAAGDAALREPLLRVAEDDGDLEAGAAAAGASSEGAAVLTPAEHEAALLKSEKVRGHQTRALLLVAGPA